MLSPPSLSQEGSTWVLLLGVPSPASLSLRSSRSSRLVSLRPPAPTRSCISHRWWQAVLDPSPCTTCRLQGRTYTRNGDYSRSSGLALVSRRPAPSRAHR